MRQRLTEEQDEIITMIKDTLTEVNRRGAGQCRICGLWFKGRDFGDILFKLGHHGELEHPEIVGGKQREGT